MTRLPVHALGLFQIFTWGSTYYLIAVLAAPIVADTGWPLEWVVGSLSIGLLVAGISAPTVGENIARRGGKQVLIFGGLIIAAGLMVLAAAPNLPIFMLGWAILGIGMACGLYDAAFSTLGGLYGDRARPSITTLTLWGGFASTVCWPLSASLVENIGWRGTCLAYAGILVAICLPLLLKAVPNAPSRHQDGKTVPAVRPSLTRHEQRLMSLYAAIQVLAGIFVTIISVHLLTLLQSQGISLVQAVAFGALIGPAQVGARILEMLGRGRHHPLWTLAASVILSAAGLILLATEMPFVGLAIILYGAGNGIFSIARGSLPLALFGPVRYPFVMGRLARPGLIAQAMAPLIGAILIAQGGTAPTLYLLAALAAANVVLAMCLWIAARS